jgi:leucyl-tRNA synthetase
MSKLLMEKDGALELLLKEKNLNQWFFKITEFSKELLRKLRYT